MGVRYAQPIEYGLDGTVRTRGPGPNAGASYTTLAYVPAPTPPSCGRRHAPSHPSTCATPTSTFQAPASPACAWPPPIRGAPVCSSRREPWGRHALACLRPRSPPSSERILASPYAGMYRLARRLAVGRHSSYDVAVAIENYLAGQLQLRRAAAPPALPARGVSVQRRGRLLPAVLRGDGADAAHGRNPRPRRRGVPPGVLRRHDPPIRRSRGRRAFVGRGVLRGHRLGAVQPDAVTHDRPERALPKRADGHPRPRPLPQR